MVVHSSHVSFWSNKMGILTWVLLVKEERDNRFLKKAQFCTFINGIIKNCGRCVKVEDFRHYHSFFGDGLV